MSHAARITGTGSAFPERRVTNDELAAQLAEVGQETSDEWIRARTGIHERRLATPGAESDLNSSLAALASQRALEMAGKRADQVDAILYATCTPDTPIPSTSCRLQQRIGARKAWTLDVNAACSGFVYALSIANKFISSGEVKTMLVIGSDILSAYTNWEDRSTCVLFGDGAGAVVVERTSADSDRRILSAHMQTDGDLWELFHVLSGGSKLETTPEEFARRSHKMQMRGREIFKIAVKVLGDFAVKALEANGLAVDDLTWIVPHQANQRIIEGAAKRIGFPLDRVIVNIDRYGNTSAATVPTAFDEAVRDGRIKPGDLVLFDVFGAGLTYGSALLRY